VAGSLTALVVERGWLGAFSAGGRPGQPLAPSADWLYHEPMPRTVDQILAEARELPADQRERLVDVLAADLDQAELSPEWRQEIRRRIRRLESGEGQTRDAHQVCDELLRKLGY
jgi:hypothetical protein